MYVWTTSGIGNQLKLLAEVTRGLPGGRFLRRRDRSGPGVCGEVGGVRVGQLGEEDVLRAFDHVAVDHHGSADTGLPNSGFLAIYGIMSPEIKL